VEYPNLLLAIRASGLRQYEVARRAGLRDGRLSEIVRRGRATGPEQEALGEALGKRLEDLFGLRVESTAPEMSAK
jgi:transcriptional regulator with XRE-family HTH domain